MVVIWLTVLFNNTIILLYDTIKILNILCAICYILRRINTIFDCYLDGVVSDGVELPWVYVVFIFHLIELS